MWSSWRSKRSARCARASCSPANLRHEAIDPLIPEIVEHLRRHNTLVLEAPAGAGKTTRVPPALLDLTGRRSAGAGAATPGRPPGGAVRRRRTRRALGETVGYQVRFEEVAGPQHAPAFSHRRRADAPPALRSRDWSASASWCWTNFTSGIWRATWRWRCSAGCSGPSGRICGSSSCRRHSMPRRSRDTSATRACSARKAGQYPLEIEYTPHSAAPLEQQVAAALERLRDAAGPRAGLPARRLRDPPRADGLRAAGAAARLAAPAAARRSVARGAGPRGRAVRPPQDHPLDQRRRKLDHHRGRRRGDR